jgi:hypothetical protein
VGQVRTVAVLLLTLFLAACQTTPGPVLTEDLGGLRSGIGAVSEKTQIVFSNANQKVRTQSIERLVNSTTQVLIETSFPVAVEPDTAAKWREVYAVLDAYAASLQALVAAPGTANIGNDVQSLAEQLNKGRTKANIRAEVVGTLAGLANAYVQVRAETSAMAIMQTTDAEFQQVTSQMAAAIGSSKDETGTLYQTVYSALSNDLTAASNRFGLIPLSDKAGREAAVKEYLELTAGRDASLEELASIRTAILALGEAHAAAAKGKPGDALFWIERIHSWLDDIKSRTDALKKANEATP